VANPDALKNRARTAAAAARLLWSIFALGAAITASHASAQGAVPEGGKKMRLLLLAALAPLVMSATAHAKPDLAIGDDEVYQRPNSWSDAADVATRYAFPASRSGVSIAWRNADQVEEVEVRVVNLGDEPGSGKVQVDVVDADGRILLHLTPPDGEQTTATG
jgi:hypothetical protein